jgi:hypothetical protein
MSLNNLTEQLRPSHPQNFMLPSPLYPPQLPLLLHPHSLCAGLASGQPFVVYLLRTPMVIIDATSPLFK